MTLNGTVRNTFIVDIDELLRDTDTKLTSSLFTAVLYRFSVAVFILRLENVLN